MCVDDSRGISQARGVRAAATYITKQQPPLCCGEYGSSPLGTDPQTDGTM